MCPYFNSTKSECRVVPFDSSAYQSGSYKDHYCTNSSNCKSCGNYEAVQRGDYKIER